MTIQVTAMIMAAAAGFIIFVCAYQKGWHDGYRWGAGPILTDDEIFEHNARVDRARGASNRSQC